MPSIADQGNWRQWMCLNRCLSLKRGVEVTNRSCYLKLFSAGRLPPAPALSSSNGARTLMLSFILRVMCVLGLYHFAICLSPPWFQCLLFSSSSSLPLYCTWPPSPVASCQNENAKIAECENEKQATWKGPWKWIERPDDGHGNDRATGLRSQK